MGLHLTKKERENLNLLNSSYRKDLDLIKVSKANTEVHELAKSYVCIYLKKHNRKFVTEGIMLNGRRADIFDLSRGIIYEVMHTEKMQSIELKKADYNLLVVELNAKDLLESSPDELYTYLE